MIHRLAVLALATLALAHSASAQQCGLPGVSIDITPSPAAPGELISVTITNNGTQDINLPSPCVFSSISTGFNCINPVFSPVCLTVIVTVPPGSSQTTSWNQLDNFLQPVGIGGYSAEVIYFDSTFGTVTNCCIPFTIDGPVGDSGCLGDGGDGMGCTDCPCGNNAAPGCPGGCKHSASDGLYGGCGAELVAIGSNSLSTGFLCFELETAVPDSFAVLVSGSQAAPANPANPCFAQNPGSGILANTLDGLRCTVQDLLRHGTRPIDSSGAVSANGVGPENVWGDCSPTFPNSSFAPGQTRHFQAILREGQDLVCATEQNTSQRISVTFAP